MELWIRSQDELLLTKIDYIIVNGLDIFNQNQLIGTYQTYERALEVLDSIQRRIEIINNVDNNTFAECVYEMPKD